MKVGDYVRTKKGIITKIEKCKNGTSDKLTTKETGIILDLEKWFKDDCVKSSQNIIDLIEENDLIKYRIHGDLYISEVQGHPEFDRYKLHIEYSDTIINLEDLEIVSVLTHEQFSQMEYKL